MEQNGLFNPVQSAYRKGRGAESALLKVVNDLLLSAANKTELLLVQRIFCVILLPLRLCI